VIGRRAFLGAGGAFFARLPDAWSQTAGRSARIGRLSPLSASTDEPFMAALRQGLLALGWAEGRNYVIESRFAEGQISRLEELAHELVQSNVQVIVAGSNPGALAAKAATGTIPIVMVTTGDPIGGNVVENLARPGGNVTGVTALGTELNLKRLEILKDAAPAATSVAVLGNEGSYYTQAFMKDGEAAARALGLRLHLFRVQDRSRIEQSFSEMRTAGADALMVLNDPFLIDARKQIVELAVRNRMFAMYGERLFVLEGGLLFYGASLPGMYRRAASHVFKLLNGAKPGDLPVEQPAQFELVINLRTAKSLGFSLPPAILARADEVIE
jgi:putative tryptophan/tyrosine transport system substrate-binding protein